MVLSSFRITYLSVNKFPNKVAADVPNSMLKNPTLMKFVSFSNVSLISLSINQILQDI